MCIEPPDECRCHSLGQDYLAVDTQPGAGSWGAWQPCAKLCASPWRAPECRLTNARLLVAQESQTVITGPTKGLPRPAKVRLTPSGPGHQERVDDGTPTAHVLTRSTTPPKAARLATLGKVGSRRLH